MKRGDEVHRPAGWALIAMSKRAADGWDELVAQAPANVDDAWWRLRVNHDA